MREEIFCSGYGGQGIMFMGKLLSFCALNKNLHTTFMPTYGPEVRGGTSYCMVIISKKEIPSPYVIGADFCLVMNEPSLLRFESKVKRGGILILNKSLINQKPNRKDIRILEVKATDIASSLKNIYVANMVMLGALTRYSQLIKFKDIVQTIEQAWEKTKNDLAAVNIEALKKGANLK